MAKILIDGTTVSKKIDGLTQYTLSILEQLLSINAQSKRHDFTLLLRHGEFPESYGYLLQDSRLNTIYANISPIGLKRDVQFYKFIKNHKKDFDFYYIPSAQYPIFLKGGLYTIHDIIYERYPEKLGHNSFLKKAYLHFVVSVGICKSVHIITVSNYSKDEVLKFHKYAKKVTDKISVIYEGFEHLRKIRINPYPNGLSFSDYFIYIGSSRGHKNLKNLFLAYETIIDKTDWKLLVVGRMDRLTGKEKDIISRINSKNQNIVFTGWINDADMYSYLANAKAFVFPSRSEGFGIPILEAYYFNVPLICSDIPVFREIAEDACLYFDPACIDDIANQLLCFTRLNKTQIDLLLDKQRNRLKNFSWEKTAQTIYSFFERFDSKTGGGGKLTSPVAGALLCKVSA